MVVTISTSARLTEQNSVANINIRKDLGIKLVKADLGNSTRLEVTGMFDIDAMIYHCPACSYASEGENGQEGDNFF